jgi:hypothetical protein
MEIQFWWAFFKEDIRDYILWWDNWSIIELSDLPEIKSDIYQYNQLEFVDEFGRMLCSIYGAIWMMSCNNNKEITKDERKQLVRLRCSKPDFNRNTWWYLSEWIKALIEWYNNWIYYRINKWFIKQLIDKWYVVNIWLYEWKDIRKIANDWVIDDNEVSTVVDAKYWHSTLLLKDYRLNSYAWVLSNNLVKISNIDNFIKSWFVYDNAYILLPNKVVRDYFMKLIEWKTKLEAFEYYDSIESKLYPMEKKIYQYCLQQVYIWKINTPELKDLKF